MAKREAEIMALVNARAWLQSAAENPDLLTMPDAHKKIIEATCAFHRLMDFRNIVLRMAEFNDAPHHVAANFFD